MNREQFLELETRLNNLCGLVIATLSLVKGGLDKEDIPSLAGLLRLPVENVEILARLDGKVRIKK
jgi:hypothetical protein